MDIKAALYFKDNQKWRQWLEQNHDKSTEVWLVHYKKRSCKTSISLNDSVEEASCFGWIDGKMKSIDEEKFILRYSPRKANSVWSRINKERAGKLIASGRMATAGLVKIEEARKNGYWDSAYSNKTRDEMPADSRRPQLKTRKLGIT
ncbi:YdeI family protein [Chloroflexota bacterium]